MDAGVCCATLLHLTVCPPACSRRQSGLKGDNVLKLHCTAQSVWTSSLKGARRAVHDCFMEILWPNVTAER